MSAIEAISGLSGAAGAAPVAETNKTAPAAAAPAFSEMLGNAIDSIASQQKAADTKILEVASGKSDDIAGMMLAIHKAGLSFQLGMEVRNRVMDAYHEVMRMQV
jgi:flagellar hook-basal body complex protein FliE